MSGPSQELIFPLGEPRMAARRERLVRLAWMVFTLMKERHQGGTVTEFDKVEDEDLIVSLRVCSSFAESIDYLNFGDEFVIRVEGIDGHNYIIRLTLSGPGYSLLAARVAVSKLALINDRDGGEESSHNTMDVLQDHAERLTLGEVTTDRAFLFGMALIKGLIDRPRSDADLKNMSDLTVKSPALRLDDRGHAIPPTEEERRARSESLQLALSEMASIPDDPPGSDEDVMRAIDAGRPERPLFRRLYQP